MATAVEWDWSAEHPLAQFAGTAKALPKEAASIVGKSTADMQTAWAKKSATRAGQAAWLKAAQAACALAEQGDETARAAAARACLTALGPLTQLSEAALVAPLDGRGVHNPAHFERRDACRWLAMLYRLTGQRDWAAKAGALLIGFADVIPTWRIYVPHYGPDRWSKAYPQTVEGFYKGWDATGLWGEWIYQDTQEARPLLEAYDLIYDSGILQERQALAKTESMLERHVQVQFNYGRTLGNMDGTQMRGILRFAHILRRPEWVHICARWVRDIYKTQFYADGWWHEGSPSYHKQIHHNLQAVFREWLQGYSDPPGVARVGTEDRYDNLSLDGWLGQAMARADRALTLIQQPNRICQVLNDTVFPQPVWWAPPMTRSESILFGCMGHAILGTGEGARNMVQASLGYGGTHGHEHYDCLNLILFAKGRELISETRYRPMDVTNTTREWHAATAGHCTVVVDEINQTGRQSKQAASAGCMRVKQPDDAINGIPDWRWRWQGHGNVMNDGRLRLFDDRFPDVQVVEADGERAYGGAAPVSLYRRTIALVRISKTDTYIIDIFRVRGGNIHDYMLHGCLDVPHRANVFPALTGTAVREVLHTHIRNVRGGTTDAGWRVTFSPLDPGPKLTSFALPQAGTEILMGDGPAMRHQGTVPFLAIRQTDGESVFAFIHHPHTGKPLIKAVEALSVDTDSPLPVAFRVYLTDGHVDTVVSLSNADSEARVGDIRVRGAFAHLRTGGPGKWAYCLDGTELDGYGNSLRGRGRFEGILTGTLRVEAGDAINAFVTPTPIELAPEDTGRPILINEAGVLTQAFRLSGSRRQGDVTLLETPEEPGLSIAPGRVKLQYFPGWGLQGPARFRIPLSMWARRD